MCVCVCVCVCMCVKFAHCHDFNARYVKVTSSSCNRSCVKTELQPSKALALKVQIQPSSLKSIHARIAYRGWRHVKN